MIHPAQAKESDFMHLIRSEFCAPMVFSVSVSLFSNAVGYIILLSSEKNMFWIYTRSLVATVKDKKTFWNRPKVQNPTNTVGLNIPFPSKMKFPVSPGTPAAGPKPAFIWSPFIHFRPKANLVFLSDLWQKAASRFRSHTAVLVRVHQAGQGPVAPVSF
jgi:hypothetical protein